MRKTLALLFALLASAASAQDIANHAIPIGGGPGSVGWKTGGPCAANQALIWTAGAGADPICASPISSIALSNTHIFVGSAGNLATDVVLSQDCTIVASGAITCLKTNNVSFGPIATLGIGTNLSSGAGNLNVVSAALTKVDDTNVTATLSAGAPTALLSATSVTLGWIGTLAVARGGTGGGAASGTLLDNITGFSSTGWMKRTGAGAYSFNTTSLVLDDIGTTRGSVLYRGAGGWAILTPGSAATVLTSNGAGADPTYQAVAGTGTVTSVACTAPIVCTPGPITGSGTVSLTQTGPTVQVITTTGVYTAPATAIKVQVYVKGGGGAGGGSSTVNGNGGGGGEGAESWFMASRAAVTGQTCTIGAGGTNVALNVNAAGGNGAATSVGAVVTAGGGAGGASGNNGGQGGQGGAMGTRDWGMQGALGYNGSNPTATLVLAAGGGGKGGGQATAAGTANTGGGGGGGNTTTASGAGGSGICTFTEFYNFLLKRDFHPANDNSPMWLDKAA